jgi:adenylate cyclase
MKITFSELKRRHVVRVAIAYVVVAWLVLQLVNNIAAPLHLPDWTATLVIVLLAIGFPVALLLAWAFEMTPEGVKRTETAPKALTAVAEPDAKAPAAVSTTPSIAVMPFVNMSSDPEQEYFSDGLSEELLNKLAGLNGLQVTGRTSSFHFKGKNEDLRTVGEILGVANILEGSVRKSGDHVRITAQLVKSADGYHLWSKTYDRKLDDIFAIQDEIAEAVAKALSVTLGVGELGRSPGMTRNVEAYDAYLFGRPTFSGRLTQDLVRRRIVVLEGAVKLDPSFALAWAALAGKYRENLRFEGLDAAAGWLKKSEQALAKAVELAPEAADVLSEMARAATNRRDWAEADRLYRKALDLYGGVSLTADYGQVLLTEGKPRTALDYLLEMRPIEPLNAELSVLLALAYDHLGKPEEGLAECDRSEDLGEMHAMVRGTALGIALAMGDRSHIAARLERIIESDEYASALHSEMRAKLDDPSAALAVLHRVYNNPGMGTPHMLMVLSSWAAYFGDPDLALRAWRNIYIKGGLITTLGSVVWMRGFRDMRRLPGFKDFLREVGLVDYWRESGDWGDFCRPVGDDDFECD